MEEFVAKAKQEDIEYFAFGDLFLEDVRRYREERLDGTGITPIFPLWNKPTSLLSREMVNAGLRAMITCVNPKQVSQEFAGREYNASFLDAIPEGIDPCGEYGEFHSFAFAGPMFHTPIKVAVGETVHRDGFVFTDLLPNYT